VYIFCLEVKQCCFHLEYYDVVWCVYMSIVPLNKLGIFINSVPQEHVFNKRLDEECYFMKVWFILLGLSECDNISMFTIWLMRFLGLYSHIIWTFCLFSLNFDFFYCLDLLHCLVVLILNTQLEKQYVNEVWNCFLFCITCAFMQCTFYNWQFKLEIACASLEHTTWGAFCEWISKLLFV
jgi:hypothetical protein